MASISLLSLPFILTLPAPFKVAFVVLGFTFYGFPIVEVKQDAVRAPVAQAAPVDAAPVDAAPELVAPKVAAKLVKPAAPAKPAVILAPVIVTMDINGELTLDGRKVGERALVSRLAILTRAKAVEKVILSADANAPAQQVTRVIDLCKSAGIAKVTFIAKVAVPDTEDPDTP